MKSLEIILRLLDNLLTAIKFRKAQNERNELEQAPSEWFSSHFNGGVSAPGDKTDKTSSKD